MAKAADEAVAKFKELGLESYGRETISSLGRCEYCDRDLVFDRLGYACREHDHLLPKTHYPECDIAANIVSACSICNGLKRDYDVLDPDGILKDTNKEEYDALREKAEEHLNKDRAGLIEKVRGHINWERKEKDGEWKIVKGIMREYLLVVSAEVK